MYECPNGSWLYVFAGLTPWVQAVMMLSVAMMVVALVALFRRPGLLHSIALTHYVAKRNSTPEN